MRIPATLACLALAAQSAVAATFYQRASISVAPATVAGSASEIGSGAVAVAWDGTNAYLAGTNGGSTARDTALVTVGGVLTAPTFGNRYGIVTATPAGRGYANLDYKAGTGLGTNLYNGAFVSQSVYAPGATTANFSAVTNGTNPAGGVAFDTRSTRLSFAFQNSGLLRNLDTASGASTGNLTTGLAAANYGTLLRDFDYDANGNAFIRVNNNLVLATRQSATAFSGTLTLLADAADANNVGQNVSVVEGFGGDATPFAIYNDRPVNSAGQAFSTVVKAVRSNGTAEPLSFLTGDGTAAVALLDSVGLYDFGYDAATQTLALLDFGNSRLYVFGATAVPEPTTLAAGVAGIALAARRRRRGC